MKVQSARVEFVQALLLWVVVMLGIRLFTKHSAVLTMALLLYPPMIVSLVKSERLGYCQLGLGNAILSLKYFLLSVLLIFPALFVGNHFYQKIFVGVAYHPATTALWGGQILVQLFVTALPEEFFFRGYLLTAVSRFLPPQAKIFQAPFGWNVVLVAALFALSHSLMALQWWHAFIFFPALVFGWLKTRTGTIWAPTLFHASSNIFAFWVALHY